MIVFLLTLMFFCLSLILYKPLPRSLRQLPRTYGENFVLIRGSFIVGALIICIFFVTTNLGFKEIDRELKVLLAMSNLSEFWFLWPLQAITHSFIHANYVHFASNVLALLVLSVYERQVGLRRYMAVLAVGCFVSTFSVFFYSTPVHIMGISGGVFALGAAYITDHRNMSLGQWILSIAFFTFFAIALEVKAGLDVKSGKILEMPVDHIGHALGALGAIIYCRLFPRQTDTYEFQSSTQYTVPKEVLTDYTHAAPANIQSENEALIEDNHCEDVGSVKCYEFEESLLNPFYLAIQSDDENSIREETLNLFFRIEDRVKRSLKTSLSYEELIDKLEDTELKEYTGLFRRYLVG